jgi:hypothetical protein
MTDIVENHEDDFDAMLKREREQMEYLCSYWEALAPDYALTDNQKSRLLVLIPVFSADHIRLAMSAAIEFYVHYRGGTYEEAWKNIGGICKNREIERENPELAVFRHLYNIVRKRLVPKAPLSPEEEPVEEDGEADEVYDLLDLAHRRGVRLQDLEIAARNAKTMKQFNTAVIERVRAQTDKEQRPDVLVHLKLDGSAPDQMVA